jgi:cytochrome c oxidase subunit IV
VNGGHPDQRRLWGGPAVVWLTLLVLLAVSIATAFIPLGTLNTALNPLIGAVMVILLVTFLMDLRRSSALPRILAGAGLFWAAFMFVLTFVDYFTRYY